MKAREENIASYQQLVKHSTCQLLALSNQNRAHYHIGATIVHKSNIVYQKANSFGTYLYKDMLKRPDRVAIVATATVVEMIPQLHNAKLLLYARQRQRMGD
jgi:hypothetical protein